jgi:hypothetical protein
MKNKVILIKGTSQISERLVRSKCQKINFDHIVMICALRHPKLLPESIELKDISKCVFALANYWKKHGNEHMLASEYASMTLELGRSQIKLVEGESLFVPYIYETIRMLHRQYNQIIIDVEISNYHVKLNGTPMTMSETIEALRATTMNASND